MEIYTHKIRDGRPKGCPVFTIFQGFHVVGFHSIPERASKSDCKSHQLMGAPGNCITEIQGLKAKSLWDSKPCSRFSWAKAMQKMWVTCMLALFLPQKARHPSSLLEHHLNQTCMNATWCVGPRPRSFSTSASNADKRDKSTSQTMQSIKQLKEQCLVLSTKLEYMIFAILHTIYIYIHAM